MYFKSYGTTVRKASKNAFETGSVSVDRASKYHKRGVILVTTHSNNPCLFKYKFK